MPAREHPERPMSARDAVTARESLGLTTDALAAELGLTPHVVDGWETGAIPVPIRYAAALRWRVAAAERAAALEASGLPECDWVAAWDRETIPDSLSRRTAHFESLTAHATQCPTCRSREAYIAERFPPMPPHPLPHWVRGVGWMVDRIGRLPRWAQPAAYGGLAFAAYSLLKLLFMIPQLSRTPGDWLVALGGVLASVSLGAALGLAYGALRAFWQRDRD
jgi:transcriptional regulator with XRE-family HTH domain